MHYFPLPPAQVVSREVIDFFGVPYVIPEVVSWPGTVIAVNIGGDSFHAPGPITLVLRVTQAASPVFPSV